jgi:hypothetical protein
MAVPVSVDAAHANSASPRVQLCPPWVEAAYDDMSPAHKIAGPAIIECKSTTIWLPPGLRSTFDVCDDLAIELKA